MIDPEYLGQRLIEHGFRVWFLYMFRVVEVRPFIEEELHEGLFSIFQEMESLEALRVILNLPPRSSKTTLAIYLIAFSLAKNPKCNFIYTSFSQDLLSQISKQLANILSHPVYKAMYPGKIDEVDFEDDPINDFWREYIINTTGKDKFSSKKIVTAQGGIVLFASIGSAITGFGCGIRGAKKFSGALIADDPNKPADIRSAHMRKKVKIYYQETLLSRLNDSNVPILLIQQRLHVEDLSGLLTKIYKFKVLKKPLIDERGRCTLPSQYTEDRLEEVQKDNASFMAQYQQEPTILGGNVIKSEWFGYYPSWEDIKPDMMFGTADTAQKKGEANDYTVFCMWFVYNNCLHLLDMVRGKVEAPELRKTAKTFWDKWKFGMNGRLPRAFYVEDKSSGTGLIQDLRRDTGIPIIAVQREKDKLTRCEDVLDYIQCGRVKLFKDEDWSYNPLIINEAEEFNRELTHKHDDILDNIFDAINKGLCAGKSSLFDNV